MSSCVDEKAELEPAPSSIKSKVWKDFGFKVFFDDKGMRNIVKETVICPHYLSELRYTGLTTNIIFISNKIIVLCYWQCVIYYHALL